MKIILDFDHVLFDTEAFKRAITERVPEWFPERKVEFLNGMNLAQFVFPDTVPFLERHKGNHELVLMTAGIPQWQSAKVESSGIAQYFNEIVLSGPDGQKAIEIQKRCGEGQHIVYLDDRPLELNAALALNTNATIVRMMRPEGRAHDEDPFAGEHTIDSLEAFTQLLKNLDI